MNGRIISERTTAGLAAAKARGRTGGRPTVMTPERIAVAKRMREEKATWDSIATTLQAGSASIRRALDSERTPQLQQVGWGPDQRRCRTWIGQRGQKRWAVRLVVGAAGQTRRSVLKLAKGRTNARRIVALPERGKLNQNIFAKGPGENLQTHRESVRRQPGGNTHSRKHSLRPNDGVRGKSADINAGFYVCVARGEGFDGREHKDVEVVYGHEVQDDLTKFVLSVECFQIGDVICGRVASFRDPIECA